MHRQLPGADGAVVRLLLLCFGAAVLAAPAAVAQSPTRLAPPKLASLFDVHAGSLQTIQPVTTATGFAVPVVLGGLARTLDLQIHDLRAANFQLLVQDATGIHPVPTPPCTTYRGRLVEEPQAEVAASLVNGQLSAIIYRPASAPGNPAQNWIVQPVRDVDPTAAPGLHFTFLATDTVPLPWQCGNGAPAVPPPVLPPVGTDTTYNCEIALEADLEYYQLNGSNVTTTQNDITSVMNQVEFIYDRDCDIQYTITTILVTTTSVYTTNDPGPLLTQFATRWNSIHGGIARDVAHLFTGRNLTGTTIGIAQLSSICNLGGAYGLSQSRFSTNFNSRVGLTSHELGHGWSAQHCDASNPCYIMCAGLGGCNNNVTLFGPTEIGQITSFAATRPCLNVVPTTPVINTVTPTNLTVFSPGFVTLSGSGFTGVNAFRVGAQTYTTGITVSNDGAMSILMPAGTSFAPTTMSVTNALGTSNSVPIIYTVTSPPKYRGTASIPSSGGLASFDFGGTPGRLWFLVLGITNTTSPFQGFPLLSPNLLLTSGSFPAPLGIDNVTVPVPGGLGLLIFYLQILEADPLLPVATGVSNVGITILL
jgi:Metallo-peptidase family M12